MGLPHFGGEQPGETYYYSPLSVYCFGVVDVTTDTMYAHLYEEGKGGKGGNNVASLLFKTLKKMDILKEETGKELNIVMDNCGGQNKNRMVLRLAPFLVENGYFEIVNLIFLVRGHTKNTCDRLFNTLKQDFHHQNVYTFSQLVDCLGSEKIKILVLEEGEFQDWDSYLTKFYMQFQSGTVQKNHVFSVIEEKGETTMHLSEAGGCEITTRKFKRGKDSGDMRHQQMKEMQRTEIAFPGLKEIKQVELFTKWRQYALPVFCDQMCPPRH